jgi:hypothetical protein
MTIPFLVGVYSQKNSVTIFKITGRQRLKQGYCVCKMHDFLMLHLVERTVSTALCKFKGSEQVSAECNILARSLSYCR